MKDANLTLSKIQFAFYSYTQDGPAIFTNIPEHMKYSRHPGPTQTVFCSMIFPQEIMNNSNPKLNTWSIWSHSGSLSLLMNGNTKDPSTNYFRNGFKRFTERTIALFQDPENISLLVRKCHEFLTLNEYDYDNFCYFFHTQLINNEAYYKSQITHLYEFTEKNPPLALAFFLIFALLETDAVSIISRYLENCDMQQLLTEFTEFTEATKSTEPIKTTGSTEPTEATGPTESTKTTGSAESTKATEAAGSTESAEATVFTYFPKSKESEKAKAETALTRFPAADSLQDNFSQGKKTEGFETSFILPASINNFFGRSKYLEIIHQLLHTDGETHHLFLYGMSGIGKTELAKKYAALYQNSYDVILFLDYQGSLRKLICDEILLTHCKRVYINGKPEDDKEYFSRKLKAIWGISSERILFIVDNFNVTKDPELKEFLKGNYCVLFTTQTDFSENGFRTLPICAFEQFGTPKPAASLLPPLGKFMSFSINDLQEPGMTLAFFQQNYGREFPKEDLPMVQQILSMFDGHLFVLELIAKQMRVSRMTAEEMLDFLKNKGIYATKELEKVRHYSSNVPQAVYEYVKHMVSSQQLTPEEQYILKNLALLPVSGVIDRNLKTWCELENYEVIEQLISKSLIRCDRDNGLLFLHPLIRELILVNLHPQACDAECLIKNLGLLVAGSWEKPRQKMDSYDAMICSLLSNLDTYSENTLRSYESILEFCWQQGHFELVIEKATSAYDFCRRHRLDYEICGSIARAAGNCCYSTGIQSWADSTRWYCRMWHYYHPLNKGINKEAAFAAQRIARSYLNQVIYCNAKIAKKALKQAFSWNKESLRILSILIPQEKNGPYYSECQSYYGDAYYMNACIRMYDSSNVTTLALEDVETAISCYCFPGGRIRSTSITAAKTLKGKLLTKQHRFDEAANELEDALQIEIQFRGSENNSHLIRIFIAQGDLYCYKGQIEEAVEQYQQAARLIQQIYEPGSGRYFHEVSSKLLLCEHAQEKVPLMVTISAGV